MGNTGNYRAKAAEFQDKALNATDSELAASYRQLTAGYQRLADWVEQVRTGRKPDPKVATGRPIGSSRQTGTPRRPPTVRA